MGFLNALGNTLSFAAESVAETWLNNYKKKLRSASDSQLQANWNEVSRDYSLDERIREVT